MFECSYLVLFLVNNVGKLGLKRLRSKGFNLTKNNVYIWIVLFFILYIFFLKKAHYLDETAPGGPNTNK